MTAILKHTLATQAARKTVAYVTAPLRRIGSALPVQIRR